MTDGIADTVRALSRIPGVHGVLIVDSEAGVPVAAELPGSASEDALAALAGALFRRAAEATEAVDHGPLRILQLETVGGTLVVVGAGDLLVVVQAGISAPMGLVRTRAARAAEELAA
jgi:predicted regulator of Ras-like GTPase activity (Roadblock/LC7/MglB family)